MSLIFSECLCCGHNVPEILNESHPFCERCELEYEFKSGDEDCQIDGGSEEDWGGIAEKKMEHRLDDFYTMEDEEDEY